MAAANAPDPLDYRQAGVDIDAGNRLIERISPLAAATKRTGSLSGLGGFGGLFELPSGYRQPVLVSGTDGVGTKLRLAIDWGRHDGVGIDLVAMCANDILVTGAEPLFFLDYYATGKLNVETATAVVAGIAEGCKQAGCALIGGETAEMPGMYEGEDYDLAGFCVGVVEKDALLSPERVQAGDRLIALPSSGPHSNGYSLIRKILERTGDDSQTLVDGQPLIDLLLAPTRIYAQALQPLVNDPGLHGLAHITGGGITENLPRVLPQGTRAVIELGSWKRPAIFDWLQAGGQVADAEMLRTFNCGAGMILCVAEDAAESILQRLQVTGEAAWLIGRIEQTVETSVSVAYQP